LKASYIVYVVDQIAVLHEQLAHLRAVPVLHPAEEVLGARLLERLAAEDVLREDVAEADPVLPQEKQENHQFPPPVTVFLLRAFVRLPLVEGGLQEAVFHRLQVLRAEQLLDVF